MENILCNMIKINRGNDVLVLDKVKKYGWEGLTFPGGHVEKMESITDSVIREAKEETNLDVENIRYIGMISWYDMDNNDRIVGFLYETDDFSGELVKENVEGTLEFIDYEELKNMDIAILWMKFSLFTTGNILKSCFIMKIINA